MQGEKRFIHLTDPEKLALTDLHKNGKRSTVRQRAHYILLSHQGKSVQEISDTYKVQDATVIRWFDRFEARGLDGLHTAKGQGRPPIFRIDNEIEVKKIEKVVEANSQNLKAAVTEIEKELGKNASVDTLRRFIKKKIGFGNGLERVFPKNQTQRNMKEN